MKPAFIIITAFAGLTVLSCKKVINVNLNNAAPQIVINAQIYNSLGPYQVTINSTVNFSQSNVYPPVSGAQVTITDNKGLVDVLQEVDSGVYNTNPIWEGQPGNTYTLNVLAGGKTYTAVSTMPQPVPLDSVGFQQDSRGGSTNIIEAIPYFQDPPDTANYYQFTEVINGKLLLETFIFEDRLSDGRYIAQPLFDDSTHMHPGDQLVLNMYGIDKNVFQYLNELQMLLQGNPFNQATPANPDSNISGGALGYFSAQTVVTRVQTVHL
jgi:Domain of unknown function (DUF4249)